MLKSHAIRDAIRAAAIVVAFWPHAGLAQTQVIRLWSDTGASAVWDGQGGAGPDTPFAVASVGKMFTAVAVIRVAERAGVPLDSAAAASLPEPVVAQLGALRGISIAHLLTMTSGLSDYYDDAYISAALDDPAREQTPQAALRAAALDPPLFAPGTDFDYSNTNFLLLGFLLEHLTGHPLSRVLQDEVFAPAGMTSTFLARSRALPDDFARGHDDRAVMRRYYAGQGLGDGGCLSTAADLVRFLQALADGRLLPARAFAQMRDDPSGAGYGMGLEVSGSVIGHSGGDLGYASDLRMNLHTGRIAVELVAREDGGSDWTFDQVDSD
jgi:D-alanyl-D-alanine carboxypeptidase